MEKQAEQQELQDIIATREDGFGYQFKTARVAKNLSIDDVARKLHLDKKIILALESEDHTQLPVAAFVCGYIRNYAKLLKIQAEPLVEYYKKERSENTFEPELKRNKKTYTAAHSQISNIFSAIAMPIIALLILLALAAGGWEAWIYISNNYISSESVESGTAVSNRESDSDDSGDNDNLADNDAGTLLLPSLNEPYNPPVEELLEQNSSDSLSAEGSLPAEGSLLAEGSSPAEGS
ncbi:MAG: helix-turn-helix domain-containing protein, partial [Gammaproteobacteria bacterium]|nr:helix-turn-helix domain-containing protein [Gammaproteobacteria bacterium]